MREGGRGIEWMGMREENEREREREREFLFSISLSLCVLTQRSLLILISYAFCFSLSLSLSALRRTMENTSFPCVRFLSFSLSFSVCCLPLILGFPPSVEVTHIRTEESESERDAQEIRQKERKQEKSEEKGGAACLF
jgi:hypothetical protein